MSEAMLPITFQATCTCCRYRTETRISSFFVIMGTLPKVAFCDSGWDSVHLRNLNDRQLPLQAGSSVRSDSTAHVFACALDRSRRGNRNSLGSGEYSSPEASL